MSQAAKYPRRRARDASPGTSSRTRPAASTSVSVGSSLVRGNNKARSSQNNQAWTRTEKHGTRSTTSTTSARLHTSDRLGAMAAKKGATLSSSPMRGRKRNAAEKSTASIRNVASPDSSTANSDGLPTSPIRLKRKRPPEPDVIEITSDSDAAPPPKMPRLISSSEVIEIISDNEHDTRTAVTCAAPTQVPKPRPSLLSRAAARSRRGAAPNDFISKRSSISGSASPVVASLCRTSSLEPYEGLPSELPPSSPLPIAANLFTPSSSSPTQDAPTSPPSARSSPQVDELVSSTDDLLLPSTVGGSAVSNLNTSTLPSVARPSPSAPQLLENDTFIINYIQPADPLDKATSNVSTASSNCLQELHGAIPSASHPSSPVLDALLDLSPAPLDLAPATPPLCSHNIPETESTSFDTTESLVSACDNVTPEDAALPHSLFHSQLTKASDADEPEPAENPPEEVATQISLVAPIRPSFYSLQPNLSRDAVLPAHHKPHEEPLETPLSLQSASVTSPTIPVYGRRLFDRVRGTRKNLTRAEGMSSPIDTLGRSSALSMPPPTPKPREAPTRKLSLPAYLHVSDTACDLVATGNAPGSSIQKSQVDEELPVPPGPGSAPIITGQHRSSSPPSPRPMVQSTSDFEQNSSAVLHTSSDKECPALLVNIVDAGLTLAPGQSSGVEDTLVKSIQGSVFNEGLDARAWVILQTAESDSDFEDDDGTALSERLQIGDTLRNEPTSLPEIPKVSNLELEEVQTIDNPQSETVVTSDPDSVPNANFDAHLEYDLVAQEEQDFDIQASLEAVLASQSGSNTEQLEKCADVEAEDEGAWKQDMSDTPEINLPSDEAKANSAATVKDEPVESEVAMTLSSRIGLSSVHELRQQWLRKQNAETSPTRNLPPTPTISLSRASLVGSPDSDRTLINGDRPLRVYFSSKFGIESLEGSEAGEDEEDLDFVYPVN